MKTITRADFANSLRDKLGLSQADAYKFVDLFFTEIEESLIRHEDVKISGLGTFKVSKRSERMGRNPKTGVDAVIPSRFVASFRPAKEFRKQVADAK